MHEYNDCNGRCLYSKSFEEKLMKRFNIKVKELKTTIVRFFGYLSTCQCAYAV